MKAIAYGAMLFAAGWAFSSLARCQATGDCRTTQSGEWNDTLIWAQWDGHSWISPALSVPDSSAGQVTILSGDTVTVAVSLTADQVVVDSGGMVVVNGSPVVFTIAAGGMTVRGTLKGTGTTIASPGPYTINPLGTLTIGNGGTYDHHQDGGMIPQAVWDPGSTLLVSGIVMSTGLVGGGNQAFHNVTWNCPAQIVNCILGMAGATIGGDVTCLSSGTGRFLFLNSNSIGNVRINGDVNVRGGLLSLANVGITNVDTAFVQGDIFVSGGQFGICMSTSAPAEGAYVWRLLGDFIATTESGTLVRSGGMNAGKILFSKQGKQSLTLPPGLMYGTGGIGTPFNIDVDSGSTLLLGVSALGVPPNVSTGSFRVHNGGTIFTAHPDGFEGNITCTGAYGGGNSLPAGAGYGYTGAGFQLTGMMLPDTVRSLIIDKSGLTDTVFLSQSTTLTDTLYVLAGVLDARTNNISFPAGARVGPGVLLTNTDMRAPTSPSSVPHAFYVLQNFPNPFNPSTTITYGLPADVFVTATVYNVLGQEVRRLLAARERAGEHTLHFDGSALSSGIYLCRIRAGDHIGLTRMILVK